MGKSPKEAGERVLHNTDMICCNFDMKIVMIETILAIPSIFQFNL